MPHGLVTRSAFSVSVEPFQVPHGQFVNVCTHAPMSTDPDCCQRSNACPAPIAGLPDCNAKFDAPLPLTVVIGVNEVRSGFVPSVLWFVPVNG